jgi:hypothetical protein
MSRPAWRTASSEDEKRRQSPSSATIAVALTGPTPVQLLDQRAAAGLAACKDAEPSVERGQLEVEQIEHPQPERDELASGRGELGTLQRFAAGLGAQSQPAGHALVEELRVDALLPGAALIDQRLAQTHQRAQLEDVRRRDPRLRQFAGEQEPQLQITVRVVGLRPSLAPPPRGRLSRVGQMCAVAGALDLLDDEPPAGRPLDRELGPTVGELSQPGTHLGARGGRDPTAAQLTRLLV